MRSPCLWSYLHPSLLLIFSTSSQLNQVAGSFRVVLCFLRSGAKFTAVYWTSLRPICAGLRKNNLYIYKALTAQDETQHVARLLCSPVLARTGDFQISATSVTIVSSFWLETSGYSLGLPAQIPRKPFASRHRLSSMQDCVAAPRLLI